MLEGLKVFKKFANSFVIKQKTPEKNDINIDLDNPEKSGFGIRLFFLSKDLEKFDFLKNDDYSNKIEHSVLTKDILRVFVPLKTQQMMKHNNRSIKNKNIDNFYQIFIILLKNERLELITNELKVANELIKGLNEIILNKKTKQLKRKIKSFCILTNQ